MGYSNGMIFAPVNSDDVRAVVGVNSHNWKDLCTSPLINMWAKFKPERIGGYPDITLAQRKANNFGLRPGAVYNSKYSFIQAVGNDSFAPGWTYDRVTATDWHRIDDFIGYDHNAMCPFGELLPFTGTLYDSTLNSLVIPCSAPPGSDGSDDGQLSISDFDQYLSGSGIILANCYFGILLYSGSRQFMATTTVPIGTNQDWQVNFGWLNPAYAGTYKGIPFLSTVPFTVDGAELAGAQIIGLNNAGVDITLKTEAQSDRDKWSMSYDVWFETVDTGIVNYNISIESVDGNPHTFRNLRIYIASDNDGTNSTMIANYGDVSVNNLISFYDEGEVGVGHNWEFWQWFAVSWGSGNSSGWIPMSAPDQGDGGDDGPDPGDWG